MVYNECAASGLEPAISANERSERKTPTAGILPIPKCDWPLATFSAMLTDLSSRLGFQIGTDAPHGRFPCSRTPRDSSGLQGGRPEEKPNNDRCDPHPRKGYTGLALTRPKHKKQAKTAAGNGYTAPSGHKLQDATNGLANGVPRRTPKRGGVLVKVSSISTALCGLGVRRTGSGYCLYRKQRGIRCG